ncbi:MAG TPA: 3-oxoacyl-ACP reductase FabG [Pyrinomonadaceae bacterium]|nr:3-oxoacyl-ACP reductase FabG [Pyrinomonadaceae bacterium]
MKDLFDLTGKTAIVTGGSRGIGKEMAEALGEAGASLMLCARRSEWLDETVAEFAARGLKAAGLLCDVSHPDEVAGLVDETVKRFGSLDILVNNAGVSWAEMPEDMPLEKWQKVIDVNLTGCFLVAQAAARQMLKQESGSIINITSISGLTSSANGPFYAGYVASKAGLIGLTRELAASWGRRGIRVNAIAPGFFHSRLADSAIEIYERSIQENNMLPRIGRPGELKGIVVFLASEASSYVTGQTIAIDGGMTA